MSDPDDHEKIELAQLISNTAHALERLSLETQACDDALGAVLEADRTGTVPATLLQNVDLIHQSVQCLAILMRNLSHETLPGHALASSKATTGIFLQEVKNLGYARGAEVPPVSNSPEYF